jgi:hypothetical protein
MTEIGLEKSFFFIHFWQNGVSIKLWSNQSRPISDNKANFSAREECQGGFVVPFFQEQSGYTFDRYRLEQLGEHNPATVWTRMDQMAVQLVKVHTEMAQVLGAVDVLTDVA